MTSTYHRAGRLEMEIGSQPRAASPPRMHHHHHFDLKPHHHHSSSDLISVGLFSAAAVAAAAEHFTSLQLSPGGTASVSGQQTKLAAAAAPPGAASKAIPEVAVSNVQGPSMSSALTTTSTTSTASVTALGSNPAQTVPQATSQSQPTVVEMSSSNLATASPTPPTNGAQQPNAATLHQFRQQLMELKQQQQLQQQLLLQHFQQQQQQLSEHHEKQLQEHIREYLEKQKLEREREQQEQQAAQAAAAAAAAQAERERVEKERIEKEQKLAELKMKKKENSSATASMEVKQRLQEFVLAKKQQREAAAAAAAAAAAGGSNPSSGVGTPSPPTSTGSGSSRIVPWHTTLGKYDNDFPLRKTASEPNLKVRSALKAKVIQRRSSPLLRRKDKPSPLKRRTMSNDIANGIPENSCSPPSGGVLSHQSSFGSGSGSTPIQEESSQSPFSGLTQTSGCDLLYSSPSLPNISLGKPHHVLPLNGSNATSVITYPTKEMVAQSTSPLNDLHLRALRLGMPLATTSTNAAVHSHPSPFFPSLPAIEGDFTPPTSPTYLQQQLKLLEETAARANGSSSAAASAQQANNFTALANTAALYSYATAAAAVGIPVPDQMAAAAAAVSLYGRSIFGANGTTTSATGGNGSSITAGGPMRPTAALHAARMVQRPLGRTQSAPLPLGHPALLQQNGSSATVSASSKTSSSNTTTSSLVKQHIRQAVLTRASSKSQMVENVEEETEAAVAAEEMMNSDKCGDDITDQVIDLTAKPLTNSCGASSNPPSSGDSFSVAPLRLTSATSANNLHTIPQQQSLYPATVAHPLVGYPLTLDPSLSALYQRGTIPMTGSSAFRHPLLPAGTTMGNLLLQSMQTGVGVTPSSSHLGGHTVHPSNHHLPRPLSRTLSSPQVMLSNTSQHNTSGTTSPDLINQQYQHQLTQIPGPGSSLRFTTALVYDSFMQKHQCSCDTFQHPEHGGRLQSIWARLTETGLAARCERLRSRKATLDEIQSCHSEAYTLLFGSSLHNRHKIDPAKLADLPIKSLLMLPCGGIGVDSDTTWNELHTAGAARMAAGCVIDLATRVALKEVKNGFAVVRPPGSHAEYQQAMGFCFFNSVAIAAKQLQQKYNMKRILIVDWDVHHGNGLQQMFFNDPGVLYISLHRHDDGNFFPGTGNLGEVGVGAGTGFNVNVGFNGALKPPMGDAEYLAAFRTIVMPIARQYDPEIVLVACGFDAARGHPAPLGGYLVTPACFSYMTQQLMTLAEGRVVMALEGGYELTSICDCAQACVTTLLGDQVVPVSNEEITRKPVPIAIDLLNRVITIQSQHWSILPRYAHLVACDALEAQQKERVECETVSAMASLTMQHVQSPQSGSGTSAADIVDEPMEEDSSDK